jgi:hypothetical protein
MNDFDADGIALGKQLIYEGNWHTYEEWGGIRIYSDDDYSDMFYVQLGGHSVYSEAGQPDWEEPYLADTGHAIELIDEWEQIQKENEEYWNHNGGF